MLVVILIGIDLEVIIPNIMKEMINSDKNNQASLAQTLFKVSLVLMFLLTLSILALIFLQKNDEKTKQKLLKQENVARIISNVIPQIKKRWELGDLENVFKKNPSSCQEELGDLSHVGPNYLRCNPNYLQCFFKKNPNIKTTFNNQEYTVKVLNHFAPKKEFSTGLRFYKIITRSNNPHGDFTPRYGAMLSLAVKEIPGHFQNIILENNCDMTYLPQRVYGYSLWDLNKEDWTWDNFGQHIYVDKYLVTNRDIHEWKAYGHAPSELKLSPKNELAFPATNLTKKQMELYCGFRGKQVMTAQVYDAATFYPSEIDRPREISVFRNPYPWTKYKKDSFLYKSLESKKPTALTPENCHKAYVKECEQVIPLKAYENSSTTWIEMNQILGGYLEYLKNPVDPHLNLKASSLYFHAQSPWHQLGIRAQWDGEGHTKHNIKWKDTLNNVEDIPFNDDRPFKIAFRCMLNAGGEN